jgi:hypothetical protein
MKGTSYGRAESEASASSAEPFSAPAVRMGSMARGFGVCRQLGNQAAGIGAKAALSGFSLTLGGFMRLVKRVETGLQSLKAG